ncbi:MAG: YkgJ family cysteine cluster protein [Myxococcales bacterium]|nr:YkgJ family cysteine cluster protein [Myxococcales bacterium]
MSSEVFDATQEVIRLHHHVDQMAANHIRGYPAKLRCEPQCSSCCVDDLTVFEVEAQVLKRHYAEMLENGEAAPEGQCALLDDDGLCRVYPHRPYVCRTQGLPLRWIEGAVENRDICELNEDVVDLVQLPSNACFELGPNEAALATIQARSQGLRSGDADLHRVALRGLFATKQDEA